MKLLKIAFLACFCMAFLSSSATVQFVGEGELIDALILPDGRSLSVQSNGLQYIFRDINSDGYQDVQTVGMVQLDEPDRMIFGACGEYAYLFVEWDANLYRYQWHLSASSGLCVEHRIMLPVVVNDVPDILMPTETPK